MFDSFFPTYFFRHAYDITPEFLRREGISAILSDLDDTLTCHGSQELGPEYKDWLETLRAAGVSLCIISNNTEERIRPFCETYGLRYVCDAKKPMKEGALRAVAELGLSVDQALLLGDQVFTDIRCGKAAGIRTAAVPPVGKRATPFIALKRLLEKPIWAVYRRRRGLK